MDVAQLELLATLRMLIGYLGERDQHAWWQSAFLATGSNAFLTPVFARTHLLARCNGVTRAAAALHDERIGIGRVYHLFRLPEDLEQGIHRTLLEPGFARRLEMLLPDRDTVLEQLRREAGLPVDDGVSPIRAGSSDRPVDDGVGPTRVGSARDLRTLEAWRIAAAHYARAFDHGHRVFPYFSDGT